MSHKNQELIDLIDAIPTELFIKLVQRGTNTWSDAPLSIRALEDYINKLEQNNSGRVYVGVWPQIQDLYSKITTLQESVTDLQRRLIESK